MAAGTEPLRTTAAGTMLTSVGAPAASSRARSRGSQAARISLPPRRPMTPGKRRPAVKPRPPPLTGVATDGAVHLALGVTLGDALALVPGLLALDQRHLDLGPPVAEVEPQWHQRQPLPADLAEELDDLALVQEQPAAAGGLVVLAVAALPRLHVDVLEEGLAVVDADEAVLDVDLARTDRLALGAQQLEARLDPVEDEVLVEGGP